MPVKRNILIFLSIIFLFSCGLEDYIYIFPVQDSDITRSSEQAIVRITNDNDTPDKYFRNYIIFYRIYVSDHLTLSFTVEDFNRINPVLASNHNTIRPFIGSEIFGNRNLDNIFRSIRFRYLELDGANIDFILSEGLPSGTPIFNSTLTFDFTSNSYPSLAITYQNGTTASYNLFRSTGGNVPFNPLPDHRYFLNDPVLRARDNIDDEWNADVSDLARDNNPVPEADILYSYVALYIAAVGLDSVTYQYIYSTPTLINVFLLPDPWF